MSTTSPLSAAGRSCPTRASRRRSCDESARPGGYLLGEPVGRVLRFEITANAFCHQMVRSIVGTLVEVGLGKRSAGSVLATIRAKDRGTAGQMAPPHGLCLWEVGYDDDPGRPFVADLTSKSAVRSAQNLRKSAARLPLGRSGPYPFSVALLAWRRRSGEGCCDAYVLPQSE